MFKPSYLWKGDVLISDLRKGLVEFADKCLILVLMMIPTIISRFYELKHLPHTYFLVLTIITFMIRVIFLFLLYRLYSTQKNEKFIEEILISFLPAGVRDFVLISTPCLIAYIIYAIVLIPTDPAKLLRVIPLSYFMIIPSKVYLCYYVLKVLKVKEESLQL